jgi:hypothetical protein
MTKSLFLKTFLCVLVGCIFIFAENSYGYLDPGTGSYVLQLLIGALFGALFTLKIFWKKIRNFFDQFFARK